jgi:cyclopropane-fatty-acyl-phospholipid synthase
MPKTAVLHETIAPRPLSERVLRALLPGIDAGTLAIEIPGRPPFMLSGARDGTHAAIRIDSLRALWRLFAGGDIGLADAYAAAEWSTPDLTQLLRWGLQNDKALASTMSGSVLAQAFWRRRHARRENSRTNSRRNIAAHYDLGNDFYARWLDRSMSYSSALYDTNDASLEAAQDSKIDRVLQLLELSGGDRVLEIGCGWGAVAERLAAAGCHVTGLTLSQPQLEYARERISHRGVSSQTDIRLQDYRDVEGRFDRIVSIEMLEAVGESYWPVYFARVRDCLRPGGTAVVQVITIAPERYASYRSRPDFIQLHIFPGGALPTPAMVCEQAAAAGLSVTKLQLFGASYALTLAEWRRRFEAAWDDIAKLGFDDRFRRLWTYYLSYCEAGFLEGALDVGLYQLRRA